MKLLGSYNSTLQSFHYQELLALYKQAISKGQFAGNQTFDSAAINTLIQQSQDFTSLPLPSSGQRVLDDSLNNPLDLLIARFSAIVAEANNFTSRTTGLISVLEKDTGLLDILLAGADFQTWLAKQPILHPSIRFSWDYGMGDGPSSDQVAKIDPTNSVLYPSNCPTNTYLDSLDGSKFTGLVAPNITVSIPAKDMIWQWTPMTTGEQAEDLYGNGWAELNLLEDQPLINFLPNPAINTILPSGGSIAGVFSISGQVSGGSIPIFVQTSFVPRRNNTTLTPQNAIANASFEAGTGPWTLGVGWTILSDGNAHTGSKYASKASLSVWSSITTYNPGDSVSYLGREYTSNSTNTNKIPNIPGSTDWSISVSLTSPTFPLNPFGNVYVEGWLKSLSANGIVTISLVCLDSNGNKLSPSVDIPGVSSAVDYLMVSEVLQAVANPSVVSGRIEVSIFGQTTGRWAFDDIRVHLPNNISPYVVNQDNVSTIDYVFRESSFRN